MMDGPEYFEALEKAVKHLHECEAVHVGSEPVKEFFRDELVWEGRVEIFALTGHPKASRAYAWSYRDGQETRYVSVLELPPVESALTAVRVAIASGRA